MARPRKDEGEQALISLVEHDREAFKEFKRSGGYPKTNGIACPQCGKELVDTDGNILLMSMPPKMRIFCPDCRYRGLRIA